MVHVGITVVPVTGRRQSLTKVGHGRQQIKIKTKEQNSLTSVQESLSSPPIPIRLLSVLSWDHPKKLLLHKSLAVIVFPS